MASGVSDPAPLPAASATIVVGDVRRRESATSVLVTLVRHALEPAS